MVNTNYNRIYQRWFTSKWCIDHQRNITKHQQYSADCYLYHHPKHSSLRTGTPFTLTVTVNPIGIITPISTTTCTGVLFTVTPTDVTNGVVPAGTLFSWSAPTGSGFTGGATQVTPRVDVIGTLNNTTSSIKTVTYLVTPGNSRLYRICVQCNSECKS